MWVEQVGEHGIVVCQLLAAVGQKTESGRKIAAAVGEQQDAVVVLDGEQLDAAVELGEEQLDAVVAG